MSAHVSSGNIDPAKRELIARSLAVRSVDATIALFASSLGGPVSRYDVVAVQAWAASREKALARQRNASPVAGADEIRHRADAGKACDDLLRAMLLSGQHLLEHEVAVERGQALGLNRHDVSRSFADPLRVAA